MRDSQRGPTSGRSGALMAGVAAAFLLACWACGVVLAEPTLFLPSRFYPDSPDTLDAVPISLTPGETSPIVPLALHQSGGTVDVRVVTEDGEPLEGLLVEVLVGRFRSVALTGADGYASVTGVPSGLARVRTRTDDPRSPVGGYAVRYAPGVIDPEDALSLYVGNNAMTDMGDLEVPEAGRIKTRVLQPGGEPWPSLPVILRSVDGSYRRLTHTDEEGRITFGGLEPGEYRLWADARGTAAISEGWDGSRDSLATAPLTVTRGLLLSGLEITPDRGAEIIGTVRNEDTGGGLPGLEVEIFSIDDPSIRYVVQADEIGVYAAMGIVAGRYKVYVPALRRYHPSATTEAEARAVQVDEPEERFGIDVEGRPSPDCRLDSSAAGVIEGTVRADFATIESATLVVWGDQDTLEQRVTEQGLYHIGCLDPGDYKAAFIPDGAYRKQYHPKTYSPDSAAIISVTAGDTIKAIDFRPERGVIIEGLVTSLTDGTPLENVPVIAIHEAERLRVDGTTDVDGLFRLDHLEDGTGLPAGSWIVGTDSVTIQTISSTPVQSVDLRASRVAAGVVLDLWIPDRGSVRDWWIERAGLSGTVVRVAEATSHPDRLFAEQALDPAPNARFDYRLLVERSGVDHLFESRWVTVGPMPTTTPLLFPQPMRRDSELRLPYPAAEDAEVVLISPDGREVARAKTDGDRARFDGGPRLAPGVYFLRWRDRSGVIRTERLVIER